MWLHHAAGAFLYQGFEVDTVDNVQRVEDVAFGFGHFLTFGIAHQAVNVHVAERHIAHEFHAEHDHPRYPEEDDVETRHQHLCGVEGFQGFIVDIRPAERGEWPQGRREPSVEYVFILT